MARRYTTPSYDVQVTSDADLTGCDAYVTFRQGRRTVTVKLSELDGYAVDGTTASATVTLTQEQTSAFKEGEDVEVQVNVIDQSGHRTASEIATTTFGRQLLETVRAYGAD